MTFNIGMVGASGAGKTSLITSMCNDMRNKLRSWRRISESVQIDGQEARMSVAIRFGDSQTKEAVELAERRFEDCIKLDRFIAWERNAECSDFKFNLEFRIGNQARVFHFCIMDYPGGLLTNETAFEEVCLPHIQKSCALMVPIDAVALMTYLSQRETNPQTGEKILSQLEIPRVLSVIRKWCQNASIDHGGVLMLVPIKTESYFNDATSETFQNDLKNAVKELYLDPLDDILTSNSVRVAYNPVDTYGCVKLDSAEWKDADGERKSHLEEKFRVEGRNFHIVGAVDLFSIVVNSRLDLCVDKIDANVAKAEKTIERRGTIKKMVIRLLDPIFPDPVKKVVNDNMAAKKFYNQAVEEMAGFSSTNRVSWFK